MSRVYLIVGAVILAGTGFYSLKTFSDLRGLSNDINHLRKLNAALNRAVENDIERIAVLEDQAKQANDLAEQQRVTQHNLELFATNQDARHREIMRDVHNYNVRVRNERKVQDCDAFYSAVRPDCSNRLHGID